VRYQRPYLIVEAGGGFTREGSIESVQLSRVRWLRRRQWQRYKANVKVNCSVKREGLCTPYARIYRQARLSSPNELEAKPTDQTIQANQASSTPYRPSSTGPDGWTTKEPNRNCAAAFGAAMRGPGCLPAYAACFGNKKTFGFWNARADLASAESSRGPRECATVLDATRHNSRVRHPPRRPSTRLVLDSPPRVHHCRGVHLACRIGSGQPSSGLDAR
jgi:hypothetical protein